MSPRVTEYGLGRVAHARTQRGVLKTVARSLTTWPAWLLGWASLCGSVSAQPEALRVRLAWQAPAASGCIGRQALERGVEALLEREVFVSPDRADQEVRATIRQDDTRWVAELSLVTRQGSTLGTREIFGSDCAALSRALVVVLATLVDAVAPTQGSPPMAAASEVGFGIGVAGDAGFRTLPKPAAGASLLAVLALARPWPALWLDLAGWLPQSVRDAEGRGARFLAFQGSLTACPALFEQGLLLLSACAGPQLGLLQARGLGFEPAHAPSRLLAAALVGTSLSFRLLAHLSLQASLALSIALLRPTLYFDGLDGAEHVVHRPELFGGVVRVAFIADRF